MMVLTTLAVSSLALAAMLAQSTVTASQPASSPCAAPEYRQFDFWVGRWNVTTADGKVAGRNDIQLLHDRCVLLESWSGAKGTTGSSLNLYLAGEKQWQQTWADSTGSLLVLRGGFRDGAMHMSGLGYQPGGPPSLNRITWTPNADGTVRQLWDVSQDEGRTWTTVFDGRYTRAN
jgi:hypothetical protein